MNWSVDSFPNRLSAKEEDVLFSRMENGDEFARQVLITHNMRLVTYVVRGFSYSDTDRDDIISCGMVGLMQAVDAYKVHSGVRFSAFAIRCIRNEILKLHFRQKKKASKECSFDDVIVNDDSSLTVEEVIPDSIDVEADVDRAMCKSVVLDLINTTLSDEQGYVVKRRYGLIDGVGTSRQEIAKELNITYSGVSHSEKRAVEKLKNAFWG